jgi:hypothetical protein
MSRDAIARIAQAIARITAMRARLRASSLSSR